MQYDMGSNAGIQNDMVHSRARWTERKRLLKSDILCVYVCVCVFFSFSFLFVFC